MLGQAKTLEGKLGRSTKRTSHVLKGVSFPDTLLEFLVMIVSEKPRHFVLQAVFPCPSEGRDYEAFLQTS